MIELSSHIESLLLENDYVIIPGFGGFVSNNLSAKWNKDQETFSSPTHILGFNRQLQTNDGVLVQSFMKAYDTNFSDATKIVEREVSMLIRTLHEKGKVVFPNIGEISISINDSYDFNPYDYKIGSASLYGLDSFEIKPLDAIIPVIRKEKRIDPRKSYTIRINKTFIQSAAAIIIGIITFYGLSSPIQNTDIQNNNYASILPLDILNSIEEQSILINPVKVENNIERETTIINRSKNEEKIENNDSDEIGINETVETPVIESESNQLTAANPDNEIAVNPLSTIQTEPKKPQREYHLIVASVVTQKDAEKILSKLHEQGYSDAMILKGENTRISISHYFDKSEAENQLELLRQNKEHENAWLFSKRHTAQ